MAYTTQAARNIREEVVRQVMAMNKFSEPTVRRAELADWRCEYCGLDLLANVETYKLWTGDHIVPRCCGGSDEFDNMALACRPCNFNFKLQWNPRTIAGQTATRRDLIEAAKAYIEGKKAGCAKEVAHLRRIVGRPPLETSYGMKDTS